MFGTVQYGEVIDPAGIDTGEAFAVLDGLDLNHVLLEDMWGGDSVHWLAEQHALAETPNGEIAYRRELAGAVPARLLAPVHQLTPHPERRRALWEQRAA